MLVNTHLSRFRKLAGMALMLFAFITKAQTWSLNQCIDTALKHNYALQIAKSDIKIAQEKNKEAMGGLYPKLYANADYRYYSDLPYQLLPASVFNGPPGVYKEAQFGVPHNLNVNASAEIPLYNSQTIGAVNISKKAIELNLISYRQMEEQVMLDISNLYYNAQIIINQIQFLSGAISNGEKLVANILLLYEAKLTKSTDVDKIKLQNEILNTRLSTARSQYNQVINLLKMQMGVAAKAEVEVNEDMQIEPGNATYYSKSTTEMDFVNARHQVLQRELRALTLSYLPNLSVYGSYGSTGFGNYNGKNDFFKTYPIGFAGVKLSWMLFSGTTLEHKIIMKKEEIRQNKLRADLSSQKQNILVENASMQYTVTVTALNSSKSQLLLAQTIYEKSVLQLKEGTASLTEVIMADNAQNEARQSYLAAMTEVMKADLELKKVSGNIISNNNKKNK